MLKDIDVDDIKHVATFTAKAVNIMMNRLKPASSAEESAIFNAIFPPILEKVVKNAEGVEETVRTVKIDDDLLDIDTVRIMDRSKNDPSFITTFIIALRPSGAKAPTVVTIYNIKSKEPFYKKGDRYEHVFRFDSLGGKMTIASFRIFSGGGDYPEYDFSVGVNSWNARVTDTANSLKIKIEHDPSTNALHIDEFDIAGIGSYGKTQIENLQKEAERKILNAFQRIKYNIDALDKAGL
ncbi:MAG: hypothetical protein LBV09_00860 [Deferribacteraceae bacterium]|jgi:hypothetical protein|nr:hypothetical protein [Deferribacteraceae bacterium]